MRKEEDVKDKVEVEKTNLGKFVAKQVQQKKAKSEGGVGREDGRERGSEDEEEGKEEEEGRGGGGGQEEEDNEIVQERKIILPEAVDECTC